MLRDRPANDRPTLLVVGVSHFDNPGQDVNNVKVDDVLAPKRQKELEALIDRLAALKPTHVAVEWPVAKQAKLDQRYHDYRKGKYTLTRNEVDQLGLRLAAKLELERVDAVDWNDMPPGKEEDYDYEIWTKAHSQERRLDAIRNSHNAKRETALLARSTLSEYLCALAAPERLATSNRAYFDYAMLGDAQEYPGANWVANWYGRNLKVFSNLVRLAPRSDDRIVAVYGAGHAFLLRQFAEQSGAFENEDVRSRLNCR